jgi:hypothetical protein
MIDTFEPGVNYWTLSFLAEDPTLYTIVGYGRDATGEAVGYGDVPLAVISSVFKHDHAASADYDQIGVVVDHYLDRRLCGLSTLDEIPEEYRTTLPGRDTHHWDVFVEYIYPQLPNGMRDANAAETAVWQRALTVVRRDDYLAKGALSCPHCGRYHPLYPWLMGTLYLSDPVDGVIKVGTQYGRLNHLTATEYVPYAPAAGETPLAAIWLVCGCANCSDRLIVIELTFDQDGNTGLHWDYAQRVVFDGDGRQWRRFQKDDTS